MLSSWLKSEKHELWGEERLVQLYLNLYLGNVRTEHCRCYTDINNLLFLKLIAHSIMILKGSSLLSATSIISPFFLINLQLIQPSSPISLYTTLP